MSKSPIDKFQEFLHEKRLRFTPQRRIVAEIVFGLAPPFDYLTVVEAVREKVKNEKVSRSTIFRTLALIAESGIIRFDLHLPEPLSSVCESEHANLIAGRCPWCGRYITHGKPDNLW